jgi:hypothetical protein
MCVHISSKKVKRIYFVDGFLKEIVVCGPADGNGHTKRPIAYTRVLVCVFEQMMKSRQSV